jgi:hypothetical protein
LAGISLALVLQVYVPREGETNPLTTAAAIDRVVHHSLIIEFDHTMTSVRAEEAARRNGIEFGGSEAARSAEIWPLGMGTSNQ